MFWMRGSVGKRIAATSRLIPKTAKLQPTPSTVVYTRLPDRALAAEFRAISDLRMANLGFAPDQFYHVVVPSICDVIGKVIKRRSRCPSTPVIINNRDIDSSLHRVYVRPGIVCLFCAEVSAFYLGYVDGCDLAPLFGFLSVPFG